MVGRVDRGDRARALVPSRYRVLRMLGAGGTGVVFEAEDTLLGRPVAIKIVDRLDAPEPLLREARFAASLRHPNVVAVYEADPAARILVMELVAGNDLETVAQGGPLVAQRVVEIGRALASALGAAHARGMLHRDVKPANVLLAEDGTPRLADFGVAAAYDDELIVGTRAYAAPEQLEGRATVQSDLFGLGATLLRIATGARWGEVLANGSRPYDVVLERARSEPLARLIDRLLRTSPDERPASAEAVEEELAAMMATRPPRRAAVASFAAVILLLSLGGSGLAWHERAQLRAEALSTASSALARHDLDRAEAALRDCDPDDPEVAYAAALVTWWRGRDRDDVVAAIDHARSVGLHGSRLELLEGVLFLAGDRLDDAVPYFRDLLEHHPDDTAVQYGLFEALWHRGEGALAIEVHRAIEERDPNFALGMDHALEYHVTHGELSDVDRVLARSSAFGDDDRTLWAARVALARGATEEADALFSQLVVSEPPRVARSLATRGLAQLRLGLGDTHGALEAARRALPVDQAIIRYAVSILRGHPDPSLRREAEESLDALSSGGFALTIALASVELGRRDGGHVAEAMAIRERARRGDVRGRMLDLLAARAASDVRVVAAGRDSTSPEVAHAARAIAAEDSGDVETALAEWIAARDASHDRSFEPHELFAIAELHRRQGDHAQVAETCRDLLAPTRFRYETAPFARSCLEWMAEAEEAFGHGPEADAARARLADLTAE